MAWHDKAPSLGQRSAESRRSGGAPEPLWPGGRFFYYRTSTVGFQRVPTGTVRTGVVDYPYGTGAG